MGWGRGAKRAKSSPSPLECVSREVILEKNVSGEIQGTPSSSLS